MPGRASYCGARRTASLPCQRFPQVTTRDWVNLAPPMTAERARPAVHSLLTALFACALTSACGGAEWRKLEIDSPYQIPKTVTISVSSTPPMPRVAEALAAGLADELNGRGIAAIILPPASGAGEVNLELYRWNSVPREFSWTRPASAVGTITVMVDTATLGVRGWVAGYKKMGGNSVDAADATGHLIGRAIATGRENPSFQPSPPRH